MNPVAGGSASPGGAGGPGPAGAGATERALDRTIGRVLQWGIGASIALLVVGVILMIAGGIDPLGPPPPPFDVAALGRGLHTVQPEAFLWLGLIVTIATTEPARNAFWINEYWKIENISDWCSA